MDEITILVIVLSVDMSIGGYPEQWITAYHNGQMNIRYLTGA